MTSKRIIRIDASALKNHQGCMRKLYLVTYVGVTGSHLYNDIEYGSAFHIFKQELKRTEQGVTAFNAGLSYYKKRIESPNFIWRKKHLDIHHLGKTLTDYIEKFGEKHEKDDFQSLRRQDNTVLVEQTFEIPIYEDDKIIVLIVGTIDDIGRFNIDGCYAFGDEKTTSSYNIADYFFPYALNPQFLVYLWAINWHIKNNKGLQELKDQRIGAFINGVFLSATKPAQFVRSPVLFLEDKLEEFTTLLMLKVQSLVDYARTETLPYREGMINDACGGKFMDTCPFFAACKMPDTMSFWSFINSRFEKREYNPLIFRKL